MRGRGTPSIQRPPVPDEPVTAIGTGDREEAAGDLRDVAQWGEIAEVEEAGEEVASHVRRDRDAGSDPVSISWTMDEDVTLESVRPR